MFELGQLKALATTIDDSACIHPLGCLAALAVILSIGYIFRRFITSSLYPNIDGPPEWGIVSGHLSKLFGPDEIAFHDNLQDTYGSACKVYGLLGKENLYVSDPRFVYEVLVKEADAAFPYHSYFYKINEMSFGPGMSSCKGAAHRAQRKILDPVFATRHLKLLVPMFHAIAQTLKDHVIKDIGEAQAKDYDILRWCNAAALEMIGQGGFGHTFGVLDGIESEYSRAIKKLFPTLMQFGPLMAIFPLLYRITPTWLSTHMKNYKNIVDVQGEQARIIFAQRKAALNDPHNTEESRDLISVLLKLNQQATEEDRLPEDQILGQMNTLLFGGHEVACGAVARPLHVLSENPLVQDRLRAELLEAPETMTYDELNSLPYLDAVCREVMRLFPQSILVQRVAAENRTIPLRYPLKGKDGREIREVRVRKGTNIYLGIRGANRCKETWGEDAHEFRPERWLEDLPDSVAGARTPGVYSSMMTFGAGPRACIGYKFAVLEFKMVLSTLIRSFKFGPGTTSTSWLSYVTLNPYPSGTKNPSKEGTKPSMVLKVSVL